jgi:hypothetical protein
METRCVLCDIGTQFLKIIHEGLIVNMKILLQQQLCDDSPVEGSKYVLRNTS